MKLNAYTFFDTAAQAYTQPFFMHNHGMAIRAFQDNINGKDDSYMSKHPDHFKLFHLGEWEDDKAHITLNENGPELVVLGTELVTETQFNESQISIIKKLLEKFDTGE